MDGLIRSATKGGGIPLDAGVDKVCYVAPKATPEWVGVADDGALHEGPYLPLLSTAVVCEGERDLAELLEDPLEIVGAYRMGASYIVEYALALHEVVSCRDVIGDGFETYGSGHAAAVSEVDFLGERYRHAPIRFVMGELIAVDSVVPCDSGMPDVVSDVLG